MAIAPDWAHPTPRCTKRLETREALEKILGICFSRGVEISTEPVPPLPFANKGRDPRNKTLDPQVISFLEKRLPKPTRDGLLSRM